MDLLAELLKDLREETASLERLLAPLRPGQWELPTPAEGWAIRDQVGHLAWFDEAATRAVADPAGFRKTLPAVAETFVDELAEQARSIPVEGVLEWFRRARATMLETFATLGPKDRVPWYGPDMSAASFVTARLMETWAHGEDVAGALGVARPPTARLRHVAALGVRAMPYGFAVRGLPVPTEPVRVELTMPDGSRWSAGPPDAADRVTGSMLDFCLLVTQRVHRDDTDLEAQGDTAVAWLGVAQAFAGPPGKGRPPGRSQGHAG
ncbi:TIGR03084 family metal-binding protein [Thermoactinospora rubra]|uniref:TIGR03084 family metal-binding protein n=1 Tax=Thermoactinospora rubra TaxID=1088767 RepID=UPI000A1140E4|nr:TIGR03084 family metal-binding protein [Thermoactinospora rubra]